MADFEVPTDHLHETMHEKAHEEGGGFSLKVALSSALIAVMAAICALFAGSYSDDAMMAQIKASDQWAYYQAKSIKSSILEDKTDLLKGMGRRVPPKDAAKAAEYKKDMADIKTQADELDQESAALMARDSFLSKGVTLFQIAIALSAIAVLTKRKFLWVVGLALSCGGSVFLFLGLR